jgi:FtsH-binding integral membrane protein
MSSTGLEASRFAIVTSLAYAAYITATCPCDPLLACHLPHFYIATLAPITLVLYLNSNRNINAK